MHHLPDTSTFEQLASVHDMVPVYRRLVSDALTPVSAFHKIDSGGCACLFESVVGGEKVGRYSFLAADPFLRLTAQGDKVLVRRGDECEEFESNDPLDELRKRVDSVKVAHPTELPPFIGGAVKTKLASSTDDGASTSKESIDSGI